MINRNRKYYLHAILKREGIKRSGKKLYFISEDQRSRLTDKQKKHLEELASKFGYNIQSQLF